MDVLYFIFPAKRDLQRLNKDKLITFAECVKVFIDLKIALFGHLVLRGLGFNFPCIVNVVFCNVELGAMLMQEFVMENSQNITHKGENKL